MSSPGTARSGDGLHIAVVVPSGLVGEALIEALGEVDWPLAELYVVDDAERSTGRVEFREGYRSVGDIARFDFSTADLVFFCEDQALADRYARNAVAKGCTVIDLTGYFADDNTVPLAVRTLATDEAGAALYAVPDPIASMLSRLIAGLEGHTRVERLVGDLLLPVSAEGKAGTEELAAQTVALLSLKPPQAEVYPAQIAFNLLSRGGLGGGDNAAEDSIRRQIRRMTAIDNTVLQFTAISVPIFYGYACSLAITLGAPASAGELSNWLAALPGLHVEPVAGKDSEVISPVTHGAAQQGVCIGRIRPFAEDPQSFSLWVVGDNIREGLVNEAIGVASILVKRLV